MTFGTKLERALKAKRISQAEFGAMVGKSQCQVSRWVAGAGVPDIDEGLKVARVLGLPLEYLADDSVGELPEPSPDRAIIDRLVEELGEDEAKLRLLLKVRRVVAKGRIKALEP